MKYKELFESTDLIHFVLNEDGKIEYINEVGKDILGYEDEKIYDKKFFQIIPSDIREDFEKITKELLDSNEPIIKYYRSKILGRNGEETEILWLISVIHLKEKKKKILFYGFIIKEFVEKICAFFEDEENQKYSEILRIFCHNINNMLTGIMGNLSILKGFVENKDALECLYDIEKSSLKLKELVSQVLNFSRREELKIEKFDIVELIKEDVNMLLKDKAIKILYEIPYESIEIEGDPIKISLAIQKIIMNSIESIEKEGIIKIYIDKIKLLEYHPLLKSGEYVILKIEDNGSGIPEEQKFKIFLPFFTLKKNRLGLGLPVCLKIVKEHKGLIKFESQIGKGTTFTIYLPLKQKD